MLSISIVGIGRMGGALAIALSRAGFDVEELITNRPSDVGALAAHLPSTVQIVTPSGLSSINSDVLLITTKDGDIAATASSLTDLISDKTLVFHTSGALTSSILSDAGLPEERIGSLHPLLSVSDDLSGAERFRDAFFAIEGSEETLETAKRLVDALGGRSISISADSKALYHAAAVTAAGHVVALFDIAAEMLSACGVGRDEAVEALRPLFASASANIAERRPEDALTGTFARGDIDTFRRHLESFDGSVAKNIAEIYVMLAERSTEIAMRSNAAGEHEEMLRAIILAKANFE